MLDGLDPEREILLTYEKLGYITMYQAHVTPRFSSIISFFLNITPNASEAEIIEGYNKARTAIGLPPLPDAKGLGSIAFTALLVSEGIHLDNAVHVRLSPDTGIAPLYFLAPDNEISAEIPDGRVASFGIFLNVPEGDDYELEYTMDDGECTRVTGELSGWPARDDRANVIRVPAGADATTFGTMPACVRH
jgi:hypothetical protein